MFKLLTISVIYCCITNHPQNLVAQDNNFYFSSICGLAIRFCRCLLGSLKQLHSAHGLAPGLSTAGTAGIPEPFSQRKLGQETAAHGNGGIPREGSSTASPLGPRLRSHTSSSSRPFLQRETSFKATPDSRGEETDSTCG